MRHVPLNECMPFLLLTFLRLQFSEDVSYCLKMTCFVLHCLRLTLFYDLQKWYYQIGSKLAGYIWDSIRMLLGYGRDISAIILVILL